MGLFGLWGKGKEGGETPAGAENWKAPGSQSLDESRENQAKSEAAMESARAVVNQEYKDAPGPAVVWDQNEHRQKVDQAYQANMAESSVNGSEPLAGAQTIEHAPEQKPEA